MYFLSFKIFEQLALALKNRVALESFTVLKHILSFRIFEQLALALKNRVALEFFTVLNIFYHSGFLSNLRLSWETEFVLEYFTVLNMFYHWKCLNDLRLPWKTVALEFFTVLNILFTLRKFWATCACPEKQRVPWIHYSEYVFFIIQDFLATSACPENRVCPEIFQTRRGGRPHPLTPALYAYGDHHRRNVPSPKWRRRNSIIEMSQTRLPMPLRCIRDVCVPLRFRVIGNPSINDASTTTTAFCLS